MLCSEAALDSRGGLCVYNYDCLCVCLAQGWGHSYDCVHEGTSLCEFLGLAIENVRSCIVSFRNIAQYCDAQGVVAMLVMHNPDFLDRTR